MPATAAPLLEVTDLVCAYHGAAVVRGVSFQVGRGEVVALLGSNGAGKTTTVKAIAGALRPQSGQIRLDGEPLHGRPSHVVVRRGITLVPEGRLVFPQMHVLDNLRMGALTRPADEAAVTLEQVFAIFPRLRERRAQIAGSMSGGEQQMLAIARGMMSRPRLMILDEPSLGLAPLLVQDLFRIVARIAASGVAIVLVEQNLHQALRITGRGYVMEKGRIVLDGPSAELLGNEFVQRAFLGL
ncbi:MAG: ABC transporter ATP-binding protein [Rhodospirillales bacterium]|nr:ABC transporter ATP-binding protein [Rhodospirillales bacterium]